ncbi:MAG: hypothetical protein EXS36_10500 [Pedosphaera sp.]|nr:hypothetical protein [Pedosphaera sp.]
MAVQVYPWLLQAVLVGTALLGLWIGRTIRRRLRDTRQPKAAWVHDRFIPPFFSQGFLILTPVLLLTGFGLAFIVRDRAEAQRAARQRAEDWLNQLGPHFDGALGYQVMNPAHGYASLWFNAQGNAL